MGLNRDSVEDLLIALQRLRTEDGIPVSIEPTAAFTSEFLKILLGDTRFRIYLEQKNG
jgi:hypothetical protein